MPTVTNEIVYAAMKEAVRRGLLPKGGSQEDSLKNVEALKAILEDALDTAE